MKIYLQPQQQQCASPAVVASARGRAQRPPPPIVIHSKVRDLDALSVCLAQQANVPAGSYRIRFTNETTNIYCDTVERHNRAKQLFEKQGLPFHSYTVKADKTHAFVLHGLHQEPATDKVADALRSEHSLTDARVSLMKGTRHPTYLVRTSSTSTISKIAAKIKRLLNVEVYWRPYFNKKILTQCYRCQGWNPATNICFSQYACLKCAKNHPTATCRKPRDLPATCVNCQVSHPANCMECPVYKRGKFYAPPIVQIIYI